MAKAKDRVSDMKPYLTRALQGRGGPREREERDRNRATSTTSSWRTLDHPRSSRVATDEDIQENLKSAVDDLRKAANRVQGKKEHSSRNATLLIAGIALGILFNPVTGPATRQWISDKLLGGTRSPSGSGPRAATARPPSRLGSLRTAQLPRESAQAFACARNRPERGPSAPDSAFRPHRALERAGLQAASGRDVAGLEQDRAGPRRSARVRERRGPAGH